MLSMSSKTGFGQWYEDKVSHERQQEGAEGGGATPSSSSPFSTFSWIGLDSSSRKTNEIHDDDDNNNDNSVNQPNNDRLPLVFQIDKNPVTVAMGNWDGYSWSQMKASMEAQMPQQIFGMGYQQRLQASCVFVTTTTTTTTTGTQYMRKHTQCRKKRKPQWQARISRNHQN